MKKFLFIGIAVAFFSCTKDIDRFNTETKKPANAPAGALFANGVKNLADGLADGSVNVNVFRFTVKHWAMAVYQDEAQYDFTTRAIPQAWWTRMYRDVLIDQKEAARIITANDLLDPVVKANQLAIIDVMQVYTYQVLVNTFGDIPYTDALDQANLFPKYDDAKTVYADLQKRLDNSISKLVPGSAGFASSEDPIYKGNVAGWIKFANSLKIKMAMTVADVDDAASKAAFAAADPLAINSAADNAMMTYLTASPNTNPVYTDIILGGRADYVAAADLMDKLIAFADPRKALYFGTNNAGMYQGGIVGKVNTFSDMSKPSAKVSAPDAPLFFADYVETEFYRAEAKERGYNIPGTAEEHYKNAIRASIIYWGGTLAEANTYLERPDVAYTTAAGTYKEKIGFQKWIALYNRPFDGWLEIRRLDYPKLTLPVGAFSGFPNRFPYPGNEQQLNGPNYTSAAAKMGGDKVEFKLFWDKF